MNRSITARIAALAVAGLMTLVMLMGIDGLATSEAAPSLLARTQVSATT